MSNMDETIGRILADPDSMAQIQALAQSLGLSQTQNAPPEETAKPPEAPAPPPNSDTQSDFARSIFSLMQQARQTDARQEALLCALKPYLRPERRESLDRAAQLARLSGLAGAALGRYGGF